MPRVNWHAFVDESKRRGQYSMAAVIVRGDDVSTLRREVRALLLPGQSRIHMTKESGGRQLQLARAVARMDIFAIVVRSAALMESERTARDDCLADLMDRLLALEVNRVRLESCDQDAQDRSVIARSISKSSVQFNYDHLRAGQEPLLWLPDVVAWAQGKGGRWGDAIAGIVNSTQNLSVKRETWPTHRPESCQVHFRPLLRATSQ